MVLCSEVILSWNKSSHFKNSGTTEEPSDFLSQFFPLSL